MKIKAVSMTIWALVLSILVAASASAGHHEGDKGKDSKEAKAMDIVDTAASAGTFNTLLAAAKAAGLVDALKGDGPLTVFAPTDEAFAALPEGTVERLLLPENKDKLAEILLYHVVSGKVVAEQAVKLESAPTLAGQELSLMVKDGTLMIDNASVVAADVMASNGVIHVINAVLIPSADAPKTATKAAHGSSDAGCHCGSH
ncbi:MAG: fasciclin domain-containing protein [Planctomycetales bacterium]|nr:fasciclin domain-containing protein [bacterium]UNM07974.1 MAG: fasciclin domain-containing protein [Planctomycetales bacterium]